MGKMPRCNIDNTQNGNARETGLNGFTSQMSGL